jgi:hypothetical protein
MKNVMWLVFLTTLVSGSAMAENKDAVVIRCTGQTNYGDGLKIDVRLSGSCEGSYGGQTIYCNTKLVFLEDADDIPAGSKSNLFVITEENRLVFKNRVILQFARNGVVIDVINQETPLSDYQDFDVQVNFGSSRTVGAAKCNRIY